MGLFRLRYSLLHRRYTNTLAEPYSHELFILSLSLLHLSYILFESLDKVQVVVCDVIVVVLDLSE